MRKKPTWYDDAKGRLAKGEAKKDVAKSVGASPAALTHWFGDNVMAYRLRDSGERYLRAFGFDRKPSVENAMAFLKANPDAVADLEDLMAERIFTEVKRFVGNQTNSGLKIECSKKVSPQCKGSEEFFNASGRTSAVHAAKVFRQHGWNVGGGFRADICPACMETIVKLRREKKAPTSEIIPNGKPAEPITTTSYGNAQVPVQVHTNINVKETPMAQTVNYLARPLEKPAIPVAHVTLRDVDKTTKRLIDMELDKVYVKERGGYIDGNNDRVVADRLGCMTEWVALVREEFHGPATSALDLKADFAKLEAMAKQVKEAEHKVNASIERMAELDKATNERLAEFEKLRKQFQEVFNATMNKVKAL